MQNLHYELNIQFGGTTLNKMKQVCSPFIIPLIFHYKSVNEWLGTHTFTHTVTHPFVLFVLFYLVYFSVPRAFR